MKYRKVQLTVWCTEEDADVVAREMSDLFCDSEVPLWQPVPIVNEPVAISDEADEWFRDTYPPEEEA